MTNWILIAIPGVGALIFGAYVLGYIHAGRDVFKHTRGNKP